MAIGPISSTGLRSYGTFVVLEYIGTKVSAAVPGVVAQLTSRLARARSDARVVNEGLQLAGAQPLTYGLDGQAFDEASAVVVRRDAPPSWAVADVGFVETSFDLVVILRRDRYLVIHCDPSTRDAILKWIRSKAQPPFRPIPKKFLNAAFVRGETRDLWMAGTHPRSRSKPDAKNMSGSSVQEALNIQSDSSFALKAARSDLPPDPTITAIIGAVGTSPDKSLVWNRRVTSFEDFVSIAGDVISLIEAEIAGSGVDRPFGMLAAEVDDLSSASAAYDLVVSPELFDPMAVLAQVQIDSANVLQDFSFLVRPVSTVGPDFEVTVLDRGSNVGALVGRPGRHKDHITIDFRALPHASDPSRLAAGRDALSGVSDDISVYYDTGHCLQRGSLYLEPITPLPFPRWQWEDFTGFTCHIEKPANDPPRIHALVGTPNDTSLFGWIVRQYNTGWLACDDGAGEVADFVHYDSVLRLIHVKAAESDSPNRLVSTAAYEHVASQATKNLAYLNPRTLADRLEITEAGKTTWFDGKRQTTRDGLIVALRQAPANVQTEVIIVQPHLRQAHYDTLSASIVRSEDRTRLHRLEFLLNGSRTAVAGIGSELWVRASQ